MAKSIGGQASLSPRPRRRRRFVPGGGHSRKCSVCRYTDRRGGDAFQEALQRARLAGLSYFDLRMEFGVPAKLSRSALYRHLTEHHRDVAIVYCARQVWEDSLRSRGD